MREKAEIQLRILNSIIAGKLAANPGHYLDKKIAIEWVRISKDFADVFHFMVIEPDNRLDIERAIKEDRMEDNPF